MCFGYIFLAPLLNIRYSRIVGLFGGQLGNNRALFKQRSDGLVVRCATTSRYPLLYVFALYFARSLTTRKAIMVYHYEPTRIVVITNSKAKSVLKMDSPKKCASI